MTGPKKEFSLGDVLEDRILKFPDLLSRKNPVSKYSPEDSDQVAALALQSFWETVNKHYPVSDRAEKESLTVFFIKTSVKQKLNEFGRKAVKEWVNNLGPKGK